MRADALSIGSYRFIIIERAPTNKAVETVLEYFREKVRWHWDVMNDRQFRSQLKSHFSVAKLVDVVVEELVDEVDVREEHSAATIAGETKSIENLPNINSLAGLSFDVSLTNEHAKLFPAVGDDLTTTEAAHRDDHVESYYYHKVNIESKCLFVS